MYNLPVLTFAYLSVHSLLSFVFVPTEEKEKEEGEKECDRGTDQEPNCEPGPNVVFPF